MVFPFLTVFIIFLIALSLRFAWLKKNQYDREKAFWDREEAAAHVPAKDLSELSYIRVPIESFPLGRYDSDEIQSIEDALVRLGEKRIINITGMTNTEVKLAYGTDNLEALSAMEDSYNELTVLLCDYAKELMEHGDYESAIPVLEFGVSIATDVSANYELLGDCYVAVGKPEEIEPLKQRVMERHLLLESKVLYYLDGLLGK